eukprot:scaffold2646_cov42-Cyclotella_meneghiniana.AAC.5
MLGILLKEKKATRPLAAETNHLYPIWRVQSSVFKLLTSYFHTTVGVYGISMVSGDLISGMRQDNAIDSRPPASKYPTRRRTEGFSRSHGGERRQGTIRIALLKQHEQRPWATWWSMVAVVDFCDLRFLEPCASSCSQLNFCTASAKIPKKRKRGPKNSG